MALIVIISKH